MDSNSDNSSPQLMENEESSFNPETNNIEGEHTPQLFANDHEPHTEDNLDEFNPFDINDSDEDNIESSDDTDIKKKVSSSSSNEDIDIDDI